MYLQLAAPGDRPGYTFVPYDESDLTRGKYVRNDVLQAATNYAGLSEEDMYMSGFFGKLWSGIKNVASGIVKTGVALVTGQSQQQAPAAATPAVNVTIPNAIAPPLQVDDGKIFGMDKKTALLVAGGGLALILLLKKK